MGIMIVKNGKIISSSSSYGGEYDGEKDMGNLNNWSLFHADPNKLLTSSYGLLSTRSATLYHTYGPARGAINKQVDYAVGPGLVFRSQPDWETLGQSKEWGRSWGKEFQKIVDSYYRRFGFYQKQGYLTRSAMYGGDSLLFFERDENGNLTDLIDTQNNQIDWQHTDEDNYTLGIQHDDLLRKKGIRRTSGKTTPFVNNNGDQNVIQFAVQELSGQLRGYPLNYSIINLARNDDTLNDAVMQRAVMESILMGVFKSDGTTNFNQQANNLAGANRKNKGKATVLNKIANSSTLGAGNIITAGQNENLEFTDLKTPSNNYAPFKDVTINYIGMATGTPPEVITSKYSTSFTAHKGALNDFVKSFMYKRSILGSNVCDIVNSEILKDAVMNGYIKAPGFLSGNWRAKQAYLSGMYLGPVPGHINPLVEVKADELSVKNTFKLRSDVARLNGNEYDNYQQEWAREQEEFTDSPQTYAEKVAKQEELEVVENA